MLRQSRVLVENMPFQIKLAALAKNTTLTFFASYSLRLKIIVV